MCWTCLRKGLFSVGALDNLDHDPSSTTSVSSFHGTGISVFQFPTESQPGERRPPLLIPPTGTEQHALPEHFANVPQVELKTNSISVPEYVSTSSLQKIDIEAAMQAEGQWVIHAVSKLDKETVSTEDSLAWAAYHSSKHQRTTDLPAITALLPLFYEKANTPAMVKHGMDVLIQAISFLNPGQVPVMTLDQPLFALAKAIQWKWPIEYGEKVFVVML